MEDHSTPQSAELATVAAGSATALRQLESSARAALAASQEQVSRLEAALTAQVEAIAIHLAEERSEREADDEWKAHLADLEEKLREHQAAWDEQRSEWEQQRKLLEQSRDELQQKFELALQDVQRFRGRIADLEQELARRPEATEDDSAELVALRAERDELSARVAALERESPQDLDPDMEQQLADLRRRFEMAVEDVRELKTKNSQLESQLAAARQTAGGPIDSGGMDWESQKRRLLASLEGGDNDGGDSVREEERTTIQGTIEMTDAIVAAKDREIADLKAQLADDARLNDADAHRQQEVNAIVDADAVIAEHRQRIVQLEKEAQEKLRATELEISLERAKIARQKVELDDLRAELEAQRNALGELGAGPAVPGAPRRRWLSKLGLNGDEG